MPLVLKNSSCSAAGPHAKLPQGIAPPKTTALADLPQIMTEGDVAAYLSLSLKQTTRMRYEKKGPKTFKLGSHWRIRREDLIAWIDEQAAT